MRLEDDSEQNNESRREDVRTLDVLRDPTVNVGETYNWIHRSSFEILPPRTNIDSICTNAQPTPYTYTSLTAPQGETYRAGFDPSYISFPTALQTELTTSYYEHKDVKLGDTFIVKGEADVKSWSEGDIVKITSVSDLGDSFAYSTVKVDEEHDENPTIWNLTRIPLLWEKLPKPQVLRRI